MRTLSVVVPPLSVVALIASALMSGAAVGATADEARLQAIRQAMVDAAVQAHTRVQSTHWMDSQGALREFNRFTSEIRLRDVRQLVQTDPAVKGHRAPVADAPVKTVKAQDAGPAPLSCTKPAAKGALRQVMVTSMRLAPDLAPAERYAAQQVGRVALAAITARAARAQHWQAVQESPSAQAYDRQFRGIGQEHVQWQLHLRVESAGEGVHAQETPALTLRWLVSPRAQQQAWLTQSDFVPPARSSYNATTPRVDEPMMRAIERSAQALAQALDERLGCDPQALALQSEGGRLIVSAGDVAGLRVGDRVLLTDARHLPQHVLEPQALDAAVLAEVKSVSPYSAELKQVAGPKQKFNPSWVAWPYTY